MVNLFEELEYESILNYIIGIGEAFINIVFYLYKNEWIDL